MGRHASVDVFEARGAQNAGDDDAVPPLRRRPLLWRALIALGAVIALLLVVVAGGAWYVTSRYAGSVERQDVFEGINEAQRPAPAPEGSSGQAALTFLVVGSDTRADAPPGEAPGGRSDVMMLVRIGADRQSAQVISLPRDTWVSIPGIGMAKLNAAYAYGGPRLLVQTVESLTGVRIDHYAAIDFSGFVEMTDALGGVDVHVAETTSNGPSTYRSGLNHLDGDEALDYVRERYGLPGGDIDRVKRQQEYLRSVFGALSRQDVLTDVGALDRLLLAVTGAMSVDEGLSDAALLEIAYGLRSLRPDAITFLTAPVAGTGREGEQSVVYLEPIRAGQMWSYLRTDSLREHAAEFGLDALPAVPN